MSTQSSGFPPIALGITQRFQNIRLLEVPDEVLDIIGNSNEKLYFKSSLSDADGETTKEGNLHLCSNDKAWLIKQVSTSNSVYVTRTSNLVQRQIENGGDEEDTMTEAQEGVLPASSLGVSAISKPTNILELYPVPATSHDTIVNEQLSHLIPTIDSLIDAVTTSQYSICDLYNHIPAPTSAIKRALAQICSFELPWSIPQFNPSDPFGMKASSTKSGPSAKAYTPTSNLLLETWHKIVEAATISDTKITGDLEADVLLEAFSEPGDDSFGSSGDVYKAIARRMFDRDGYFVALGLITKATDLQTKDTLNEIEVSRWVGNMILCVDAPRDGSIETGAFEEKCENAVPTAWVEYCSVEVLGDACKVLKDEEGKEQVSWQPFITEKGTAAADRVQKSNDKLALAGSAMSKGKKKWHEKFAAQRNVKK